MKASLIARIQGLLSRAKSKLRRPRTRAGSQARADLGTCVNRIISDAILFNETAASPDRENRRVQFILQKLSEFGYSEPHVDESGNLSILIPARDTTDEDVLLFADISTFADSPSECLVSLEGERARGRGLAGSSVGVAALLVLAEHLAASGASYERNLVLLFTAFDPGRQDTQPLERFVHGWTGRLQLAVHVRSLVLGRIEQRPMGTCKLAVTARTEEAEVTGSGGASAISVLASAATALGSIRWDSENNTFLNIARLEAGAGFGWHAAEGILELEIFSTDAKALEIARSAVSATIDRISAETGASVQVDVKSFYPAGGAEINAGLNEALRRVYGKLRIKPRPTSIPDHSAFMNSLGIPSVSLGVTTGRWSLTEEFIDVKPLETGFRQLLAFLDEITPRRPGDGA